MRTVPVRIEASPSYLPAARYAISALLYPLGLRPEWVGRGDPAAGGIYYGPVNGSHSAPCFLPLSEPAEEMFSQGSRYEAAGVAWREWEGERWPLFFPMAAGHDLVAGTFLMLSGWQEITTRGRDDKGRFRYSDSLQARLGFGGMPVVDAYREWLAGALAASGITVARRSWGGSNWAFCPTIDVDYIRKWRPGMVYREVVLNLLLNRRRGRLRGRAERFAHFASDFVRRGDVFRESLERIIQEIEIRRGNATVFLKAGAHGPYDVAYSLQDSWLSKVIADARASGFEFGLHPSYFASAHGTYLSDELSLLSAAVEEKPTSVRQHYLRYEYPTTLRLHEAAGFRIDSTLGFAEREGFRRGTCVPFRLFDVEEGRETAVWEMPLTVMDSALFNRRLLSVEAACEATRGLMDRCRRFGGVAVMLWHNVLWDDLDAVGWNRHFTDTLRYCDACRVVPTSLSGALGRWLDSA